MVLRVVDIAVVASHVTLLKELKRKFMRGVIEEIVCTVGTFTLQLDKASPCKNSWKRKTWVGSVLTTKIFVKKNKMSTSSS